MEQNSVIKLTNISKSFKNKIIYQNLNLEVKKGECIGIVGTNGSGKSVLFNLISGLINPDSGSVEVNNKTVGGKNGEFPDNIGVLINSPGYIDFYSGFYNLKLLAEINNKITDEQIYNTMKLCGLDPESKVPVKKYSMGMKQKLGIAQAFMENQDIILLDEPYNALDFTANKDITNIINQLHKNKKTILLTSHQHNYLEKLCDKIYIVYNNKLELFNENFKTLYFS